MSTDGDEPKDDDVLLVAYLSPSSFSSFGHGSKMISKHLSTRDPNFVHSAKLHEAIIFDDSIPTESNNVKSLSIEALESENMEIPSSIPEYGMWAQSIFLSWLYGSPMYESIQVGEAAELKFQDIINSL